MSKVTTTTTTTKIQYRVMVKMKGSSRYTAMGWVGEPHFVFTTREQAKGFVQRCLDPEMNYTYGYLKWPFEGAEFRTEGRVITTIVEQGNWNLASKVEAQVEAHT